jgi:putative MATE family efflux protein
VSVFASTCFLVAGLALRGAYASQLAGDAHTASLACEFLLLFIPALALQFAMMGLGAALRGLGDMLPGLVAQVGTVALNIGLAPVLIFGGLGVPPLGVTGAALATLLSSACGVLGLAFHLRRTRSPVCPRWADCRPHLPTWSRLLAIGLPAGGELLLVALTTGIIFLVARPFGAPAQAGFGIAARIAQAVFMPTVAIGFAVATVVGQNFGSLSHERVRSARRESAQLALVCMALFTAVCQWAPATLVSAFSGAPEVVSVGVEYLRTASWGFFATGVVFASGGVFQGLGNTLPALMASLLRAAAFVVPLLVLSQRSDFALRTVWLASLASVLLQCAVQQLLLERELRLTATRARNSAGASP